MGWDDEGGPLIFEIIRGLLHIIAYGDCCNYKIGGMWRSFLSKGGEMIP